MLVCLVALSLYLCSPICLYVCILLYDVYNATPACIIYSYSCPLIACVHTSTLVLRTYYTVLRASPSLCMLPHTYTHTMYVHLCTIQYTLHTIHGILPPLTRIHVRSISISYTPVHRQVYHIIEWSIHRIHLLNALVNMCGVCYISRKHPHRLYILDVDSISQREDIVLVHVHSTRSSL